MGLFDFLKKRKLSAEEKTLLQMYPDGNGTEKLYEGYKKVSYLMEKGIIERDVAFPLFIYCSTKFETLTKNEKTLGAIMRMLQEGQPNLYSDADAKTIATQIFSDAMTRFVNKNKNGMEFINNPKPKSEMKEQPPPLGQNNSTSKSYVELEEFFYLANKMVINNKASIDTENLNAFIKNANEEELLVVKEEIRYMMFSLLHLYTYAEVVINQKLINTNDERALDHFKIMTNNSLERAFLTSFNDFDYSVEKYKNRYGKYTQYLIQYKYQDFERSFLECFAGQLTGTFEDSPKSTNIDIVQLIQTARWVFRTYGETTKLTLSKQNFII